MYRINRMTEMDALGYSINHVLRTIDKKEIFLVNLYRGVLDIAIEVLNDKGPESLQDKLDLILRNRDMDAEIQLSIFDYLLNLIERTIHYFSHMGVPDEVKYMLEIRNENLTVGIDKIKIDFLATYYAMDKRLKAEVEKEDIIDNPTSEEIGNLLNSK